MQQFRTFALATDPTLDWPEWLMPGAQAYGIDRSPISKKWYVFGPVAVRVNVEITGEGCSVFFDIANNGWRQTRTADRCFQTVEYAGSAANKMQSCDLVTPYEQPWVTEPKRRA